ncbi:MAG: hypothetical protein WC595_05855 [Candidatus Nanoarchaeia archaeon]
MEFEEFYHHFTDKADRLKDPIYEPLIRIAYHCYLEKSVLTPETVAQVRDIFTLGWIAGAMQVQESLADKLFPRAFQRALEDKTK